MSDNTSRDCRVRKKSCLLTLKSNPIFDEIRVAKDEENQIESLEDIEEIEDDDDSSDNLLDSIPSDERDYDSIRLDPVLSFEDSTEPSSANHEVDRSTIGPTIRWLVVMKDIDIHSENSEKESTDELRHHAEKVVGQGPDGGEVTILDLTEEEEAEFVTESELTKSGHSKSDVNRETGEGSATFNPTLSAEDHHLPTKEIRCKSLPARDDNLADVNEATNEIFKDDFDRNCVERVSTSETWIKSNPSTGNYSEDGGITLEAWNQQDVGGSNTDIPTLRSSGTQDVIESSGLPNMSSFLIFSTDDELTAGNKAMHSVSPWLRWIGTEMEQKIVPDEGSSGDDKRWAKRSTIDNIRSYFKKLDDEDKMHLMHDDVDMKLAKTTRHSPTESLNGPHCRISDAKLNFTVDVERNNAKTDSASVKGFGNNGESLENVPLVLSATMEAMKQREKFKISEMKTISRNVMELTAPMYSIDKGGRYSILNPDLTPKQHPEEQDPLDAIGFAYSRAPNTPSSHTQFIPTTDLAENVDSSSEDESTDALLEETGQYLSRAKEKLVDLKDWEDIQESVKLFRKHRRGQSQVGV